MKQLASVFCMDICAYAVMGNHYHVVLRIAEDEAKALSLDEILVRWSALFSGNFLANRYQSAARSEMSEAEIEKVREIAEDWRSRLADISWFMRCLNEFITRIANKEDGCKGRFWEGRFKSQALLDDVAVLACMTYVDLNPIRAGLAKTPESSAYTAIQERIRNHRAHRTHNSVSDHPLATSSVIREDHPAAHKMDAVVEIGIRPALLLDFVGDERIDQPKGISYSLDDYLQLVDWTGRAIIDGKRGGDS